MRTAVIGGGLMGVGIAHVFVRAGADVRIFEPNADVRASVVARLGETLAQVGANPSLANGIDLTDTLAQAVDGCAYVTEAAPEKLDVKRAIFAQLVDCSPAGAILASNTSVIPITRIAAGLASAHRIVGTHWWNPAYLVPLVEVVQAEATDQATVDCTMALLETVGKQPAHVRKDVPGFVANRLQHALWREAIAMVAEDICDAATLDACVKNSFGLRLAVLGPLENADLVGLDLTLDIHRTMMPELDRHDRPHEYLVAHVDEGKLGFKSGEGFRRWTPAQMADLRSQLTSHLLAANDKRLAS